MFSKNPITISLIILNALVYAFLAWKQQSMGLNTGEDILAILHAGANFNPFVMGGEYWRLISSMFLHYGFLHLAVNMYGLWQLGELLEPGIGSGRYALLYFICGMAAGIASLFFNVLVASAGASGAIFGLYGFMLGAQLISFYNDKQRLKQVLTSFAIFVVINALIARGVNVDMAGHIGGAVAGLIIAFCHFKLRVLKTHKELAAALVAVSLLLFVVPKGQLMYFNIFKGIAKIEQRASITYNSNVSANVLRDSLELFKGEWTRLHGQLGNIGKIPASLRADATVLEAYTQVRAKDADYRLKFLEGNEAYADSLDALKSQFQKQLQFEHDIRYLFSELTTEREEQNATSDPSR